MLDNVPEYQKTWVGFFDILGFRNMVSKSDSQVELYLLLDRYYEVLGDLKEKTSMYDDYHLPHIWFSDSFVIYSRDDSDTSYVTIQQAMKHFLDRCIPKRIGLRGALAYGDFFADVERGVFFGPALIEAYEYAEDQDCIGLLLAPSAKIQCESRDIHPARHSFSQQHMYLRKKPIDDTMTYTFCSGAANFKHPHLRILEEMKRHAPDSAKVKYTNTITKIEAFWQML